MEACNIHLAKMLDTHGKMKHTSDKNVNTMEKCNIHLTKMLDTHDKMQHTSDTNVRYTWQNVTYI